MAMKKAEMEAHRRKYKSLMAKAKTAKNKGVYHTAIELALSSWGYIDGMMRYERKYEEKDFDTIEAIDLVLRYAPLLLDFKSLDRLEALLKDRRQIEKNTSDVLADKLTQARTLMWDAHRLWGHLADHPQAMQSELRKELGGDQEQWRWIAEQWGEMGFVRRTPEGRSFRLALATRMGKIVSAKCSNCGDVVEAPKAMLLSELPCPECKATVPFVILSTQTAANTKE